MTATKNLARYEQIGRREVAGRLGIHQDSVSRLAPDGLGAAVVAVGGVGNGKTYLWPLVAQFWSAWNCRREYDRPCFGCRVVLKDFAIVAEHLKTAEHAWGQCAECRAPWLLDLPAARHATREKWGRR